MDDYKRTIILEKEIENLDNELDEYSWNVKDLTTQNKNDIKELYKIWKSCLNKKITITGINGNIRVSTNITINGNIIWNDVMKHHTLHFINCSDSTIVVSAKVNHITLEKCNNVNIRCTGGSISGIDSIRCNNVTHIFESGKMYFIDISNSTECIYIVSEYVAKDVIISSLGSSNIDIHTICKYSGNIKHKYKTNINIFQALIIYNFRLDESGKLLLYTSNSNGDNLVNPIY